MERTREEWGGGKRCMGIAEEGQFASGEHDGVLQKYVARSAVRSCVCIVLFAFRMQT